MGKIENGVLGAVSGKVGPVMGSTWKGIAYIKARPKNRKVKDGSKEKINQNKFRQLHGWLKPLLSFVREGFRGYSPLVEGYNAAKSYNLKHAFVNEGEAKVLDPSLVRVSYGDLPLPGNISFVKEGDRVKFSWDTQPVDDAHNDDQAMLLLYDDKTHEENMKLTGQFRHAGHDELKLPAKGSGFHVYVAFLAHDRSRQSHSVYLGKVER